MIVIQILEILPFHSMIYQRENQFHYRLPVSIQILSSSEVMKCCLFQLQDIVQVDPNEYFHLGPEKQELLLEMLQGIIGMYCTCMIKNGIIINLKWLFQPTIPVCFLEFRNDDSIWVELEPEEEDKSLLEMIHDFEYSRLE
jgi:hypothetical protein